MAWRFSFWLKSCLDEEKLKLVRISLTKCFAERILDYAPTIWNIQNNVFTYLFCLNDSIFASVNVKRQRNVKDDRKLFNDIELEINHNKLSCVPIYFWGRSPWIGLPRSSFLRDTYSNLLNTNYTYRYYTFNLYVSPPLRDTLASLIYFPISTPGISIEDLNNLLIPIQCVKLMHRQ